MTEPITVLIVDDEAPARALVRELIADYPQFVVAAECANGYEAVKAVAEHQPDLLFLDIQMPKLDGFEVLELLERRPQLIFVTAYAKDSRVAVLKDGTRVPVSRAGYERLREVL